MGSPALQDPVPYRGASVCSASGSPELSQDQVARFSRMSLRPSPHFSRLAKLTIGMDTGLCLPRVFLSVYKVSVKASIASRPQTPSSLMGEGENVPARRLRRR